MIVNERGNRVIYRARKYQAEFEKAMFDGYRRAFLLYHRRAGKDIACWSFTIYCALADNPGLYFYILPTFQQGRRVIWNGLDESGKRLLEYIPSEYIKGKPNATEMKVELLNGSIIQIVGSEQFDSLRGTNPKGVVFSEFAMQDPRCYSEVISPILVKNGGWAVFNTTPLGKNHAYDLWQMAERSDDWYTQKLTIDDTRLIARNLIDKEIAEGKPEEVIQQEYYCSFARGIDGTWYGRLLSSLHDKNRVCSVPYDPNLPVFTSWDLGFGDFTSIWFFQKTPGGEVHFIDFFEDNGDHISHYVNVLNQKEYTYSTHYFPHDVRAGELGTGQSRYKIFCSLGVKPVILLDGKKPIPFADGVQAVRATLPRCWFDKEKCKLGLKHLENYRKRYNNSLNCFIDRPVEDLHAHAADSFRYACLGIQKPQGSSMSEADADRMFQQYALGV